MNAPNLPLIDGGRLWLRIRTRLALLALAIALPFAGHAIYVSIVEARIERAHAVATMLSTAQITAARLDDHLNDIRSILRVLSSVVGVEADKTADNDTLLRGLATHLPTHINNITVWTAAGENIGSLNPRLRQNGGTRFADRRFFKEAMVEAGAAMSAEAPVTSVSNGSLISVFGLPVRRNGEVVGVVAAAARLGALQKLLVTGTDLPDGAILTITDSRGVVLARSAGAEQWIGKRIPGAASTPDGVRDGPSADGTDRIAGLATAHAAPWRVYVGVPTDIALAPVRARLRASLLTAAAVLAVGLLLAALVGEQIASPLRQLCDDAAQFGAGNLSHRSRARGKGEVGLLARTLNQMASQLQERAGALEASQQQLRQVTDNLPALISYLDRDERFRFANRLYLEWLGTDPKDVIGKNLAELYGQAVYERFKPNIRRALAGERVVYEREIATLGGLRQVEVVVIPDLDAEGQARGLYVMMTDITARRDAEAALQQSERRMQMVADNIPAIVTYVDREERYRFVNAYLGEVFDTDPASLLGKTVLETGGKKLYAEIAPHVVSALRGEEVMFQGTWNIQGQTYHYQSTYVPDIDAQGTVRGYYAMTFDISALKETQHRLDLLARVDTLTGLPNRRQFDERLHDAMARTRRNGLALAVMFLDVDHFKAINDTLGHSAGDIVLKELAARLKANVRSTDVVARLAGDEFVILLEGIHEVEQLKALAGKIVRAARAPLLAEGRLVHMTTSVGVATYDGGETSPTDLLAAADKALYVSKRQGRDRFSLAHAASATVHALFPGEPAEAGSSATGVDPTGIRLGT